MTPRIYTQDSKQPDVDVLVAIDPGPGAKPFLARVRIGDTIGWLWVNNPGELGTKENNDRKTPLMWAFATAPDSRGPVRLRELTPAEQTSWDGPPPQSQTLTQQGELEMTKGDDVAVHFTRLAGNDVVALLNLIPERHHHMIDRICDLAEALLAPGGAALLPDFASAALREWVDDGMFPRKALALAILALRADVVHLDDDEGIAAVRAQLLGKLHGIYSTAPEAALAAVLQLGGPSAVGIPMWLVQALEDTGVYTPCQHLLDRAELAVRNTGPGRLWYQGVAGLGYVLFEKS